MAWVGTEEGEERGARTRLPLRTRAFPACRYIHTPSNRRDNPLAGSHTRGGLYRLGKDLDLCSSGQGFLVSLFFLDTGSRGSALGVGSRSVLVGRVGKEGRGVFTLSLHKLNLNQTKPVRLSVCLSVCRLSSV